MSRLGPLAAAHTFAVRVYWEDTDAGGIVYHASYLRFLERGRTELLRARGIDQSWLLAETGVGLAVRRMSIDFIRPARLDDLLEVRTTVAALWGASIALRQSIAWQEGPDAGGTLIEAEILVACIRAGRACRVPAALMAALSHAPDGPGSTERPAGPARPG